ncbi:MAG TPA: malonate decarboxylase acyl carrier protein [Burkholderiales bacterium]|nr:malonate decarboxylase acyl carrier protein [Burkholderiales bacterium]
METLDFTLESRPAEAARAQPTLCGVVGSGNLEVLIMPGDGNSCAVTVNTSAEGFHDTWQAVLKAFAQRHAVGSTRITINDLGATPAVVTLRLEQTLSAYLGSPR